jgi:stringent starvation protein B
MAQPTIRTTSRRPYLIRAMYDWVLDNGLTPYVLVDARAEGVRVPERAVKDGHIVLNIAPRAVSQLELGNERVRFLARFGGVSHSVEFPVLSVQAIYAFENGDGMVFPPHEQTESSHESAGEAVAESESQQAPSVSTPPVAAKLPEGESKRPHLRVVK